MTPPQTALFLDIDGTYHRDHTILPLLERLASAYPRIEELMGEIRPMLRQYKTRDIEFDEVIYWLVTRFWNEERYVGIYAHEIELAAQSIRLAHAGELHRFTRALVRAAQTLEMPTFAITGTHQEIAEALLSQYPLIHVIGTQHHVHPETGRLMSGIRQDPAKDKGKVVRTLAAAHVIDLSQSVAVGDTISDASMMHEVGFPICFNPDEALFQEAERNDWPVVMEARRVMTFQGADVKQLGSGLPMLLQKEVRHVLKIRKVMP